MVEIADTLRITAYDAWYLACAESLGTPLVTADTRLLRAAPGITRPLAP